MNNVNNSPITRRSKASDPNVLASQLAEKTNQIQDIIYDPKSSKYGAKCDGVTDDTNAFQQALNDASTNGGGIVLIPVGTSIVSSLNIPSYCGLEGRGRKSILKQKANSTGAVIQLSTPNEQFTYLSNFTINGNMANQTNSACKGIYYNGGTGYISNPTFNDGDARHIIKDIYIYNTYGIGFDMNGRGECHVHNIQVFACNDVGMNLNAFDMWYSNLSSGANKKTGIVISQNNVRLVNCKSWNNGYNAPTDGYGFKITSTGIVEGVILTGCEAQANYNHGFAFINARACIGSALNSELNGTAQNSFGTTSLAGVGGFYFNASRENNIQGICRNMVTLIQEYALVIDGYSISNIVNLTSWSMKTGNINDISSNKDNNHLTIIDVASGDVNRYYRNMGIDLLRVNGVNINSGLSPFGTYAKEGTNILNAYFQKEVSTLNGWQELIRFEAFQTGNSQNVSRVKIQTQVNNGDVDIEGMGNYFRYNGQPMNIGLSDSTANRPLTGIYTGKPFFDVTLGKPIWVKSLGTAETETLTITAGATTNGNVTVTLNGVATNVAVSSGDSTSAVATKIANAVYSGWIVSISGSTVTFVSKANNAQTAPTFSGGSTGVTGSMVVTNGGFHPTWVDATGTTV